MGRLNRYLFGSLPDYFKLADTYKNSQGKGLLERFLVAIETEGEEYLASIDALPTLIEPENIPAQFLQELSSLFGKPPTLQDSAQEYRTLLSCIVFINRLRGTMKGIISFFNLFGIEVSINVVQHTQIYYDYSDKIEYDGKEVYYDSDCNFCVDYYVSCIIPTSLSALTLEYLTPRINKFLDYLMPINATLIRLEIIYVADLEDHYLFDETNIYLRDELNQLMVE